MEQMSEALVLTAQGLVLLRSRLADLGDRMRSLGKLLETGVLEEGEVAAHYEQASAEHAVLCAAILEARSTDTVPGDPETVLVGDHVVIQVEDGAVETFMMVHLLEASLDGARATALTPTRISVDSPLGRALLGRKVSEVVEVTGPPAPYECRIVHADRY